MASTQPSPKPQIADMIRATFPSAKVAFQELRERVMYLPRMKENVSLDENAGQWTATYAIDGKEVFHIVSRESISVVLTIPRGLHRLMQASPEVPSRFKELAAETPDKAGGRQLTLSLSTKDDVRYIFPLLNFKYKNLGWKGPL